MRKRTPRAGTGKDGGRKSKAARAERVSRIMTELRRTYPDAGCALVHRDALQLLVATILSAQCTDERVNQVTPAVFARWPTAADLAAANPAELEAQIRPTGFFCNKAKSLIGLGRALVERHQGRVPDTMGELVPLPGVGRKTANVVLGTWFGKPAIPVDTHVTRLAGRLRLSAHHDPVKIEQDLMELLPTDDWTFASHALIWHGRLICQARRPRCEACTLRPHCPSARVPEP